MAANPHPGDRVIVQCPECTVVIAHAHAETIGTAFKLLEVQGRMLGILLPQMIGFCSQSPNVGRQGTEQGPKAP